MAAGLNRLSVVQVARNRMPGKIADGGGLYLWTKASGAKVWTFRHTWEGKAREAGFGSVEAVSLADAREKAATWRAAIAAGRDPMADGDVPAAAVEVPTMTFKACCEAYIAAHGDGWKNAKHRQQWRNTLETYAEPVCGNQPVAAVDLALVMKVLEPIWREKPETAARLRGRIEAVLDWATVRGYRQGDNPARWRGHLSHLLPARGKVQKVEHHAALPYDQIGAFMTDLRSRPAVAARALEFAILTACRTGEVLGATWSEIDLDAKLWIIPGPRMKAGREHRAPLSEPAVELLRQRVKNGRGEFVFPGARKDRPLSQMSMLMLLRRMGRGDLTAHGFRSTFRDWAEEQTSFPGSVAEAALAHAVGDKVEAAYRRGDLLEKRRELMTAWANHCAVVQNERRAKKHKIE
jgi:integrase